MVKLCGEPEQVQPRRGRVELPEIEIHRAEYIRKALWCDRCSCAPDTIAGVYIGNACKRHDEHYDFIRRQWGYLTRMRLKWEADKLLQEGISECFERAGKDGWSEEATAYIYRHMVSRFNILRRVWKAITFQTC